MVPAIVHEAQPQFFNFMVGDDAQRQKQLDFEMQVGA